MNETDAPEKKSFWNTTLGAITKITALVTAITALILAIRPFINSGKDNNNGSKFSDHTNQKPEPTVDYLSIATKLANDWCKDYKNRNVDGLVENSSIPFYADKKKILNSLSEVRQSYDAMIPDFAAVQPQNDSTRKPAVKMELVELKIYKISELKNKGQEISGDMSRNLNLEEDPYIALIRFNTWHDYMELIFRKTGNTLKVAGWLD